MRKLALTVAVLAMTAPAAVMAQQGYQQGPQQGAGYAQGQSQSGEVPLYVSPGQVRMVQWALNRIGLNTGGIDGQWDPQTSQAIQNFQQAKGLEPTGNLNLATLAALGLEIVTQPQQFAGTGASMGFQGGQQGGWQQQGQAGFGGQQQQPYGQGGYQAQAGLGQQGYSPQSRYQQSFGYGRQGGGWQQGQ